MSKGVHRKDRPMHTRGSLRVDPLDETFSSIDIESVEPTREGAQVYRDLRDEFVETLMSHPSVVAIYGDSESPTIPGISDADFTIIVRDTIEDRKGLIEAVRRLNRRYPILCGSGPGLLPESIAPYYPLFDSQTAGLDRLAGTPISPAIEDSPILSELRFFDYLMINPHAKLIREILPRPSVASKRGKHVGSAMKFANTLIATHRGSTPLPANRLVLHKRRGLRLMSFPRHHRQEIEFALSDGVETDSSSIDRATEFRSQYFQHEPSDLAFIGVILDLIACCSRMISEFAEKQSIYPDSGTYRIRHKFPMLASPVHHVVTGRDEFSLSHRIALAGNVVPPALAYHLAALPNGARCFLGTGPTPSVQNDEVSDLLELRHDVFKDLLSFVQRHNFSKALSGTFSFPHIVNYLHRYTFGTSVSRIKIKQHLRFYRNRRVMDAWELRLQECK